jgi:prepilin-type N-terminal cleavage/methylation domain-containing protein
MEKSLLPHKSSRGQRGFTLLETIVAITILTVGLLSVAALMTQMVRGTSHSRSMSTAAMLATEKLEDLNRYPSTDANVANGGGLGADTAGYFDTVQVSAGSGIISVNTNGTIITHNPDGTVTNVAPPASAETMTFDRRWQIEVNPVITGGAALNNARRVTVLVILPEAGKSPVTFQTSMVRP